MSTCAAGYDDHVDADVALAFADDALPAAERAVVERRIDACGACREAVAAAARDTAGATKRERPMSMQPVQHRSMQLVAGDVVGRYIVERPIGAGGMGVVSLARDPELRRAVVIKLVRPDASDDDLEARLRREAQAMAQLSHPNVVQIFDTGRHGDRVFLAMEFIAGQTLDAWLIEKERSVAEIIAMFLQCGAGLEAAHRAGLLHRDFKPTNVLVDRDGVAKVTDFGLARALGAPGASVPTLPRMSGVHAVLTHVDAVIGTPAYMAPEQAAGEPLDGRTDQYALALALLDALVGQQASRRTVKPSQPAAEIEAALARVPVRPRAAIVRALALQPADRWPDLAAFLRELAPQRRERRWWPIVAVGVLGIVAATVFFVVRGERVVSCIAEAPRAWAKSRANVEARLANQLRVFASWHAAHVLEAIDKAVAEIGANEVARCEGSATTIDAPCSKRRRRALDDIAALPDGNPWPFVHTIASCEETPDSGADLVRADELDRTAYAALGRGDLADAARDFEEAATIGERTNDDALRGRAVLGLLALSRVRGDLDKTRDQVRQLEGLLAKHGRAPADVYRVAIASADAFIELGDVAAAFAAIERATTTAKTADEELRARATHAWAMHVLRWEPAIAKRELAEALDDSAGASPVARAAAQTIAARLAFDRKDGVAAKELLQGLPATDAVAQLYAARARALAGEVDGALQDIAAITGDDTTALRVQIARAHILADAGSNKEAIAALQPVLLRDRRGLSAAEEADAALLECDAKLAIQDSEYYCGKPQLLTTGHQKSPLQARYLLQRSQHLRQQSKSNASWLDDAIEILAEANARPILVAELRLESARDNTTSRKTRKVHALAARPIFAAAGRLDEARACEAIIAAVDAEYPPIDVPADAGVAAPPRDASGDPWAP